MDKYGGVETWTKLFEITLGDTFFSKPFYTIYEVSTLIQSFFMHNNIT